MWRTLPVLCENIIILGVKLNHLMMARSLHVEFVAQKPCIILGMLKLYLLSRLQKHPARRVLTFCIKSKKL